MSKKKPARPPATIEAAVETALRETGGVTVTGGSGLPTVVRGAPAVDALTAESERLGLYEPPATSQAPEPRPTLPSATGSMDGAAKGIRWEPGPVWSDRIERMAEARALSVEGFLESLLRRAWVSTPAGLRKGG